MPTAITFTFSDVPTQATNNFLIVNVKDAAGNVQIKALVPAPPAGSTNTLGVNATTTQQVAMLEKLAALAGSDDPLAIAFALMFTRNPNLTASDISTFAQMAKLGIIGQMEPFMTAAATPNHATAAELATFKKKLVYNAATGAKDLRAFAALTKSAVDTPAQEKADMNKASSMMADIFVDAADAAGIDLNLILAAFDAADPDSVPNGTTLMNSLSASFRNSMMQAATTFYMRLAAMKVRRSYAAAMTALNASTAEKTRLDDAVTTMIAAMSDADAVFAPYFTGVTGYDINETLQTAFNSGHLSSTATTGAEGVINAGITAGKLSAATKTVGDAMDYVYSKAFSDFATNAEINTMRQNISTALGGNPTVAQLAADGVGTYQDFNGNTVNWPIPQTVAVNFVATAINNGGGLTYTRTTLPLPANMTPWLGSCSIQGFGNQASCQNNGGTWTPGRTDFSAMPASFAALLGMHEDIMIAEFTRFYIFESTNPTTGGNPPRAQEQAAKKDFVNNLQTIVGNLGGTTDGTTAITTAQKKALVLSAQQPSLH